MRQSIGHKLTLPAATTSAPSAGGDGISASTWTGTAKVAKAQVTATVSGATSCILALWGYDGATWGRIKLLAAGAQVGTLTIHEVVENVGIYTRFALQQVSPVGTPTVAATITEVFESAIRGD